MATDLEKAYKELRETLTQEFGPSTCSGTLWFPTYSGTLSNHDKKSEYFFKCSYCGGKRKYSERKCVHCGAHED